MNCKQGDLALVICGPDRGQIVKCLEQLPAGFRRDDLPPECEQRIDEKEGPLWRLDRLLEWGDLVYMAIAPDSVLMPIGRGSPDDADTRREQQTSEAC